MDIVKTVLLLLLTYSPAVAFLLIEPFIKLVYLYNKFKDMLERFSNEIKQYQLLWFWPYDTQLKSVPRLEVNCVLPPTREGKVTHKSRNIWAHEINVSGKFRVLCS